MRWNPARQEWVTYSASRVNRTAFPAKEYCPLCPSGDLNFPTEIPFKNFEIAVFPNRWPSFNTHSNASKVHTISTKPSNGYCEVVVYSSNHNETVADMSLDRIILLTKTWIDRYKNLMPKNDVEYVMPFENRGEECGVTLHHPHGQIYCYPFLPPVIEKEVISFQKENFILSIMEDLKEKYFLSIKTILLLQLFLPLQDMHMRFGSCQKYRWLVHGNLMKIKSESFANCLQKVVRGYDSFLGKKCPYIMGFMPYLILKMIIFTFM